MGGLFGIVSLLSHCFCYIIRLVIFGVYCAVRPHHNIISYIYGAVDKSVNAYPRAVAEMYFA